MEKAGVVKEDWNGYNVLHDMASRVGALDIGFLPSARTSAPGAPPPKVVYLLGSDDYADADVPAGAFVIYQARPQRAAPAPSLQHWARRSQVETNRLTASGGSRAALSLRPRPTRCLLALAQHAGKVGMPVAGSSRCHAGRAGMRRSASLALAATHPEREARAARAGAPWRPRRGARGRGPAWRRLH